MPLGTTPRLAKNHTHGQARRLNDSPKQRHAENTASTWCILPNNGEDKQNIDLIRRNDDTATTGHAASDTYCIVVHSGHHNHHAQATSQDWTKHTVKGARALYNAC